jgi:hypothetical protein
MLLTDNHRFSNQRVHTGPHKRVDSSALHIDPEVGTLAFKYTLLKQLIVYFSARLLQYWSLAFSYFPWRWNKNLVSTDVTPGTLNKIAYDTLSRHTPNHVSPLFHLFAKDCGILWQDNEYKSHLGISDRTVWCLLQSFSSGIGSFVKRLVPGISYCHK